MQQPYLYAFSAPNIWKARPESPHSIYINTRSIYNAGLSDRILIKNDAHGFVREFIDYLVDVHILSAEQIMWVPNERYSLDEEIVANKYLFNTIKSHCADRNYHIVPYSTTIEFLQWYTKLHSLYPNLQVVGDDISWCKLHTKAMLHEYISAEAQNSRKEVRLGELGNLNIPHGYIANNREELVEAYKKMSRQGYKNILIKPVFTGSGMGIVRVDSMTTVLDYTFWDFGPVMLEEEIGARPSKNHQISLSIQYSRKKLYRPSIQLVDKFRWLGNMSPMIISETTINLVENIAKDIIAHTQPKGFGGFDFVIYDNEAYLVDVNVGRFTGAHPMQSFLERFARDKMYVTFTHKCPNTIHELLKKIGKNCFIPGVNQEGIFPLFHIKNIYGVLIIIASSPESLIYLREQAIKIVS